MNEALIQKIQKLLSLAQSDNEHEAKMASAKAQELLLKYNLDLQEVQGVQFEYGQREMETMNRLSMEAIVLVPVVCEHFRIKHLLKRKTIDGKKVCWFVFYGEKTNLQIGIYTYQFLVRSFTELFKDYRVRTGAPIKARLSYYHGLTKGLEMQFAETKRKVESERGLVLAQDPGLVAYYRDQVGRVQNRPNKRARLDEGAFQQGVSDGKNLRIRAGVDGSATASGRALKGKS